jgi:hypothetical protein
VVVEVRELHVRDGIHPRALHRHAAGAGLPSHLVVDVLRGEARRDELDGDRSIVVAIARQVCRQADVHVPRQDDHVARIAEGLQDRVALGRVAVPLIRVGSRPRLVRHLELHQPRDRLGR